jgi:hypothetical protein
MDSEEIRVVEIAPRITADEKVRFGRPVIAARGFPSMSSSASSRPA